jgi:hypothetical protein
MREIADQLKDVRSGSVLASANDSNVNLVASVTRDDERFHAGNIVKGWPHGGGGGGGRPDFAQAARSRRKSPQRSNVLRRSSGRCHEIIRIAEISAAGEDVAAGHLSDRAVLLLSEDRLLA